jgi:hypothetical protein
MSFALIPQVRAVAEPQTVIVKWCWGCGRKFTPGGRKPPEGAIIRYEEFICDNGHCELGMEIMEPNKKRKRADARR